MPSRQKRQKTLRNILSYDRHAFIAASRSPAVAAHSTPSPMESLISSYVNPPSETSGTSGSPGSSHSTSSQDVTTSPLPNTNPAVSPDLLGNNLASIAPNLMRSLPNINPALGPDLLTNHDQVDTSVSNAPNLASSLLNTNLKTQTVSGLAAYYNKTHDGLNNNFLRYRCPAISCGRISPTNQSYAEFAKHVSTHASEFFSAHVNVCKFGCPMGFFNVAEERAHYPTCPNSPSIPIGEQLCPVGGCGGSYPDHAFLTKHWNRETHSTDTFGDLNLAIFRCDLCHKAYPTAYALLVHITLRFSTNSHIHHALVTYDPSSILVLLPRDDSLHTTLRPTQSPLMPHPEFNDILRFAFLNPNSLRGSVADKYRRDGRQFKSFTIYELILRHSQVNFGISRRLE
jgi:hypothetical protein